MEGMGAEDCGSLQALLPGSTKPRKWVDSVMAPTAGARLRGISRGRGSAPSGDDGRWPMDDGGREAGSLDPSSAVRGLSSAEGPIHRPSCGFCSPPSPLVPGDPCTVRRVRRPVYALSQASTRPMNTMRKTVAKGHRLLSHAWADQ